MKKTIEDRFWAKVDKRGVDECWPWLAATNGHGYGRIMSEYPYLKLATHVSLEIAGRPRQASDWALHSCDNRICVNPNHLRWGDVADNRHDAIARGRWTRTSAKGTLNPACRLTVDEVLAIRASNATNTAMGIKYGVSQAMISRIRLRHAWKHI